MSRKLPLLIPLVALNAGIGLWGFASGLSPTGILVLLSGTTGLSVVLGSRWPRLCVILLSGTFMLVLLGQAVARALADPDPTRVWLVAAAVCLYVGAAVIAGILARRGRLFKQEQAPGPEA